MNTCAIHGNRVTYCYYYYHEWVVLRALRHLGRHSSGVLLGVQGETLEAGGLDSVGLETEQTER